MPWTPKDASRKTHRADTPARKAKWAAVANSVLAETGDEGRAVREANGVLANASGKAMNAGGRARKRMRKDPPIEW